MTRGTATDLEGAAELVIFGLSAALGWGLADFFGALAGRRIGALGAVVSGQVLSALVITGVLLVSGESLAPLSGHGWILVLNGAAAAFAYATHYKALELGPVAVVSPIGAGYAVVGVLLAIVILDERPGPVALVGAGIAVLGVALVSTDLRKLREGIKHHVPGLWWSVAAAIGFGVAGFLLGFLSQEAGWIAGVWGSRVAMLAFYAPMAVVLRRDLRRFHVGVGFGIALLAGAADLLGVVSFAAGAEQGYVSIVLAASAVFPLIAIALSMATFHERLVPNQYVGIALVVSGLLLLGLG